MAYRNLSTTSNALFSNKENYITSQWQTDYPTHSELSYEEIAKLSSRSRDIGKWFKEKTNEFILYKEAPDWFLDAGKDPSEWTQEIQEKYKYVKILNKEYSDQINELSKQQRLKLDKLDQEHKNKLVKTLSDTPELVMQLFNTQMLPLEKHLKVFEFKTKKEADMYLKEELKILKQNTYESWVKGEISSNELVELLFEK